MVYYKFSGLVKETSRPNRLNIVSKAKETKYGNFLVRILSVNSNDKDFFEKIVLMINKRVEIRFETDDFVQYVGPYISRSRQELKIISAIPV